MCVRSLRFVVEELLRPYMPELSSFRDMMNFLEDVSSKIRASKLWVDCLIKSVLLIMQYVRAERTGDWLLHLYASAEMIKYFFAAGHVNFAQYGLYNLLQMINLPEHVMQKFLLGEHVMRILPAFLMLFGLTCLLKQPTCVLVNLLVDLSARLLMKKPSISGPCHIMF